MGIIFGNENQIPKAIEEYIIKMGLNCMITSDYGFSGSTIYHNVYTMCYWIHRNMIDVSHMSFFYATSLHIIDCMMSMCTQLLGTIKDTKLWSRITLPLQCLITQIYHTFMFEAEFVMYEGERVFIESEQTMVS